MARNTIVGGGAGFLLEDVGGSFARFVREAPKDMRATVQAAVKTTCFALERRMAAAAPVGPDAPHIRNYVKHEVRGLNGRVGFIDATDAAAPGSDASIGDVALFNEYRPNAQAFMRPSAELESSDFVRRVRDAIRRTERDLSGGGGLL